MEKEELPTNEPTDSKIENGKLHVKLGPKESGRWYEVDLSAGDVLVES